MIRNTKQTVLILGASDKPERYAYKAFKMLTAKGHDCILVHPLTKKIENHLVFNQLSDVKQKVDTLTVYVNAQISSGLIDAILKLNPKRVIFNPGSENKVLEKKLHLAGIETLDVCTLVLLSIDQF